MAMVVIEGLSCKVRKKRNEEEAAAARTTTITRVLTLTTNGRELDGIRRKGVKEGENKRLMVVSKPRDRKRRKGSAFGCKKIH